MSSKTDKLLDMCCAGESVVRCAGAMRRTESEIDARILQLMEYADAAARYAPVQRISRKGMPVTRSEKEFIAAHAKLKLPPMMLLAAPIWKL